jgi:hypothetical protein
MKIEAAVSAVPLILSAFAMAPAPADKTSNGARCLRNVVTLFHQIEREMRFRVAHGRPAGFAGLRRRKPLGALRRLLAFLAPPPLDLQSSMLGLGVCDGRYQKDHNPLISDGGTKLPWARASHWPTTR